jgi:hypothetical protein
VGWQAGASAFELKQARRDVTWSRDKPRNLVGTLNDVRDKVFADCLSTSAYLSTHHSHSASVSMRLSVEVPALDARFKPRKFALPVQANDTLERVWVQIEARYKRNYLDAQQAAYGYQASRHVGLSTNRTVVPSESENSRMATIAISTSVVRLLSHPRVQ